MDFDIEQYYGKMRDAVDDVQARTSERLIENLELHEMKENAFFDMAERIDDLDKRFVQDQEDRKKTDRISLILSCIAIAISALTLIATIYGITSETNETNLGLQETQQTEESQYSEVPDSGFYPEAARPLPDYAGIP